MVGSVSIFVILGGPPPRVCRIRILANKRGPLPQQRGLGFLVKCLIILIISFIFQGPPKVGSLTIFFNKVGPPPKVCTIRIFVDLGGPLPQQRFIGFLEKCLIIKVISFIFLVTAEGWFGEHLS